MPLNVAALVAASSRLKRSLATHLIVAGPLLADVDRTSAVSSLAYKSVASFLGEFFAPK